MGYFGRTKILTELTSVTAENVVELLNEVLPTHDKNAAEINYLYRVYKGDQAILQRTKEIRPEINNKTVVNLANAIVSFKTSYLLGDPMQYVSRSEDESVIAEVNRINDYMFAESKANKDKKLAEWVFIAGVAPRLVYANDQFTSDNGEAPFSVNTLDPRQAFVVYNSGVGNAPVCGVVAVPRKDPLRPLYCVYTRTQRFDVDLDLVGQAAAPVVIDYSAAGFPTIPMVEYENNSARLGAFEVVLSLLDTINRVESNRIDAIEQFVQALMVFQNIDLGENDTERIASIKALQALGALLVTSRQGLDAKVYTVDNEMSQDGTQTVVNDLLALVYSICGMPSQSSDGSKSTSDTGSATIMRDGWYTAEARAKDTEDSFKASEMLFMRVALAICRNRAGMRLNVTQLESKFTRKNYADLLTKSQVLTTLLSSGQVHPLLAFSCCGLFTDSQDAYSMSMEWMKTNGLQEAQKQEKAQGALNQNRAGEPSNVAE